MAAIEYGLYQSFMNACMDNLERQKVAIIARLADILDVQPNIDNLYPLRVARHAEPEDTEDAAGSQLPKPPRGAKDGWDGACRCRSGSLDLGRSHPQVQKLVQAMEITGISRSSVSKRCKDIDDRVNAFLERPLSGNCIISGSMQPI